MIEKIQTPRDLKKLSKEDMLVLAQDIREALFQKLSKNGGHFGPNFGMIEATIALHYVFDSPIDKFVFDVSHQSYTHKMLTGRKDAFLDEEKYLDVSGYTNPNESEHDYFTIGHTSTSVSLAAGLAKARDLKGGKENVIAIIGDGSLSGGEALEGIDFVGEMQTNLIVLFNDNAMSIAENHGGLYKGLEQLRNTHGTEKNNIFKSMGLDYMYVENGNDIETLISVFEKVKDIDHPIVIHMNTIKGKGYEIAERNKEDWHWCLPFHASTGEWKQLDVQESYAEISAKYLLNKMKRDPLVSTIVAGVPTNIGFTKQRRLEAGNQFIDVGIAEEHAIALVSGMAKNGAKPVFATHASFMQRTYDQLSQDLCINKNPATILINTASIYGMKDVTHLGIFDISLISNIPNMVYLAPTNKNEYLAMLDWSIEQDKYPVAIRIPCNGVIEDERQIDSSYDQLNTFKMEQVGNTVAIIAVGDFYQLGEQVTKELYETMHMQASLINPRFVTGIDDTMLERLKDNHELIITLEDGVLEGGFGQKIASYYGVSKMKVKNYGYEKTFLDRYDVETVLKENRLTSKQIVEDIKEIVGEI